MAEVDSYLQLWIKCYLTNVQINVYELSTVNYAKCKKTWGYGTNWLAKNFMKIALLVTYSFFLWHETKNLKNGCDVYRIPGSIGIHHFSFTMKLFRL